MRPSAELPVWPGHHTEMDAHGGRVAKWGARRRIARVAGRARRFFSVGWLCVVTSLAGCGGGDPHGEVRDVWTGAPVSQTADLTPQGIEVQGAALAETLALAVVSPLSTTNLVAGFAASASARWSGPSTPPPNQRVFTLRESVLYALATASEPCPAGGATGVSLDDSDNDGKLSVGDVYAMHAANCRFDALGPALQGGYAVTLVRLGPNGAGGLASLEAVGWVNGFSTAMLGRVDGAFSLGWQASDDSGVERMLVHYQGLRVSRAGQTDVVLDVLAQSRHLPAGVEHTVSGSVTLDGQEYRLEPTPLSPLWVVTEDAGSGSAAWPIAGGAQLRDADGDALVLSARQGLMVDIAYIPSDPRVPLVRLGGLNWGQLLGLSQ